MSRAISGVVRPRAYPTPQRAMLPRMSDVLVFELVDVHGMLRWKKTGRGTR